MLAALAMPRRRLLVPEVVQTSAMDCGPASLKCLLAGFGIPVSYGRLREACQTDVDGTSIDTLEEVAVELGLEADQVMVPADHVLVPEAGLLPAITVVRLPSGLTHFVVVWSCRGGLVQLMDPGTGRRWSTPAAFLDELYIHTLPVPAEAYRAWAGSDAALGPLRRQLAALGLSRPESRRLIDEALAAPGWRSPAALDAATRMVGALVRAAALTRGREAQRLLLGLLERARGATPAEEAELIPERYWTVRPLDDEQLRLRGAVLVSVRGRRGAAPDPAAPDAADRRRLSPELRAALEEQPLRPARELLRLLRADGVLTPAALLGACALAAVAVVIEAMLFRVLLDVGRDLGLVGQRLGAVAALAAFLLVILLLQLGIMDGVLQMGRRLEARLRIAFLQKIPRLGDRYFQSRLVSDMAERSHSLHQLRGVSLLGEELCRWIATLIFTTAGIAWIDPASAPIAILAGLAAFAVPMVAQPALWERDLRVRTHAGALSRFYLDALLGLVAVRSHGAERSVRREHEDLLVSWLQASLRRVRVFTGLVGAQSLLGLALAAWLLHDHLARGDAAARVLLLAYWVLNLPLIGQEIAQLSRLYPAQRSVALRLMEPLGAPDAAPEERARAPAREEGARGAVAIRMEAVDVRVAGHTILHGIDLTIPPGTHVALVGRSGAGKSSLVGLLLGWHRPAAGRLLVDGGELDAADLDELRRHTAWVDPSVQLWNRSLLDNLRYGAPAGADLAVGAALAQADLLRLVEKLPDGLQSVLGEGGGLASGGEGQRVRLGRAMLRPAARLVILDEPFRGLDRATRRELLSRARALWQGATLLCITHDVSETQAFERAVVVEQGRVVEDGAPSDLAARPGSRYRSMLDADAMVRRELWADPAWRRLRVDAGQALEVSPGE
jgi:ATP-binding cassette subfamily B protein